MLDHQRAMIVVGLIALVHINWAMSWLSTRVDFVQLLDDKIFMLLAKVQ